MKVLVDMNLTPNWVKFLQNAGFDVQHWHVVGRFNAPDTEIMAYAKAGSWIVLTNDLDFSAMLALSGDSQPTVVQVRAPDLRIEVMAISCSLLYCGSEMRSARRRARLSP